MNLMRFKVFYFLLSLVLILPGLYFLLTSGLKLGIDYTGGALLEYKFPTSVDALKLKEQVTNQGVEVGQIIQSGENTYIIRTKPIEADKIISIKEALAKNYPGLQEQRVENVGPVIGNELKQKAILALSLATLMIVLYISFSFRKVPKPTSSWRFGVAAIVALLHDVIIVLGVFAILGKIY